MGTTRKNSGAGLVLGPSHHTERLTVLLVMVIAMMQEATAIQVMYETVRQPSPGCLVLEGGNGISFIDLPYTSWLVSERHL